MKKEKEKVQALKEEEKTSKRISTKGEVSMVIGILLCLILIPILIINCVLIVKNFTNPDAPPSIGGKTPLIVLTGSMDPLIAENDIIFVEDIEADDVKVGDVIAFFDPGSKSGAVLTHRIMDIYEKDGKTYAVTAGDANVRADYNRDVKNEEENPPADGVLTKDKFKEVSDREKLDHKYLVTEDQTKYDRKHLELTDKNVIGKYTYFRIPFVGKVSMAMQTTWGWIICIVTPLLIFFIYEMVRRKKKDKGKDQEKEALLAELEALRAAAQTNAQSGEKTEETDAKADELSDKTEDAQTADASEEKDGEEKAE